MRGGEAVSRRADHDRARRRHPPYAELLAELDMARGIAAGVTTDQSREAAE